jgi:hypothetical protein
MTPTMTILVEFVVLHSVGSTDVKIGGCSNCAALYVALAYPAPVVMFTTPLATVVTHSNWVWACSIEQRSLPQHKQQKRINVMGLRSDSTPAARHPPPPHTHTPHTHQDHQHVP